MSSRSYEEWRSTFRKSINRYDYYVDFNTVYKNAERYKVEIHILNSLVGSKNIEQDFADLLKKYPECLKIIPTLLAVRGNEIYCQDDNGAIDYQFDQPVQSIEEYQYFMRQTGLFDMLEHHIISNLYDYVTGVEVGLNSNGRKNRGGHQMEDLVEHYRQLAGVEYYKEMNLTEVEQKWDIDLSSISADGVTQKRWDFVVKTKNLIAVIETNFYASSGSKLNETARSYKMIAEEAAGISNFKFIWITDGVGWNRAQGNLRETFNVLSTLFNISDLEHDVLLQLFSEDTGLQLNESN